MSVCLCVCLSVCLCVCLKVMHFDIPAPIATKLHTRTKDCRGRFLSQFGSARLVRRALSEGPLFVTTMTSCTVALGSRARSHGSYEQQPFR